MKRRRHPPKNPPRYQTALLAKYYAPHRTTPTVADQPVGWDTMTEAEREAYRQEQQRAEDMELPDNLLFGG